MFEPSILFFEQVKFLRARRAHRNNDAPAVLDLIDQRPRHVVGRAGHDDCVKGRMLRPALIAVANLNVNVLVA